MHPEEYTFLEGSATPLHSVVEMCQARFEKGLLFVDAVEVAIDYRGLLHAILTCVTAGPGLGFNRALLFLADENDRELVAAMAIGPATREEAHATWAQLASESMSIEELLRKAPAEGVKSGFQEQVEGLKMALVPPGDAGNPLLQAYRDRRVVKIHEPEKLGDIPPELRVVFAGTEVVCVPLVAKERSVGLIVADNAFSREPIHEHRVQLLQVLALVAGLALDNARINRQLERQARQVREALDQVRAAQDRLIHSERLATVGAVVARVSHEIRNPLTTIGGFARSLSKRPDDIERVARNADIIVEEVEKLEALLKEMLDFTSPRAPSFELTDINPLVEAFVTVHRGAAVDRRVVVDMDLEPSLPKILVDRHQLQRVFLNLWQNALQAMEETVAGSEAIVGVRTWRVDDAVKVAISDTGGGISAEHLERIFTPFFTTKRRGTGLGLAVVKKIVDDHRGSIEVRSECGMGTAFIVALPAAR